MISSHVAAFDSTLQKTHHWLADLAGKLDLDEQAHAYAALRAVLHVLRDRLIVDEAAHLGAQLPMLVRGFYFEGYHPAGKPRQELHRKSEFVEAVRQQMHNTAELIDPEQAVRAVFSLLNDRITAGEIHDIRQELPADLQDLWPQ